MGILWAHTGTIGCIVLKEGTQFYMEVLKALHFSTWILLL